VHAVDTNELAEHFVPDPYVSEGFMKVQANEIVHKQGAIALVGSESMLEELRIVVWNRDTAEPGKSAISEADRLAHRNYWQELIKAGQAGVVCEFAADAPRFGVAVMKKEDDEKIRLLLDTDPLVKARLAYRVPGHAAVSGEGSRTIFQNVISDPTPVDNARRKRFARRKVRAF
jgi:hypothetical protein